MNLTRFSLMIVMLWGPVTAYGQLINVEYDWHIKRNKNGIQISTSKVPGSAFKAVRGEMTINGTAEALVALVNDLSRCSEWADLCVRSEQVKSVSEVEQFVYIYNNIPFPIKDRDVVAHNRWSKDSQTGRVTLDSVAVKRDLSEKLKKVNRNAVRIYQAVTQWHFTTLEDGRVKVENFAHIDPNGPTPAWLINALLVNSPYKTMKKMRALIEAGNYHGEQLAF